MIEYGFKIGISSACVFHHPEEFLSCSVHGDDFTTVGPKSSLDKFVAYLKTKYELKEAARLGPGEADDRESRVLNRIVRWPKRGLEYEADPRQAEKIIEELGLEECKGVAPPAVRQPIEAINKDEPIPENEFTRFRAIAARGNYMSADRPECQFAAKEICRFMAEPTKLSVEALKRLGRYLVKYPRLVFVYPFQDIDGIDVYVDTDHAGCLRTRKSTSGGCVMAGSHLLKSWASTQPTITLSSGEAELHGVVRGGAIGIGFLSLLADLGVRLLLRLWTDSSATQGICARQGLGKVRHLDVQELWVQQRLRRGDFSLYKVEGDRNPGDLFTKPSLTSHRIRALPFLLGCYYVAGRAKAAPVLRKDATKKANPFGKAKWCDFEDDNHKEYEEDEVTDILKRVGLPHMERANFIPETPKQETKEVEETRDSVYEHGSTIAKTGNGRSELPERLTYRERNSNRIYDW